MTASREAAWLPAEAIVPAELRTDRAILRPLLASDVDRDYDAVMSSRPMLRTWSQSDWPAEGFTRAENLADLERHEREHLAREAFTFTALELDSDRCVGCVYITPLHPTEARWAADAPHVARVGFWVRSSEIESDLDRHLLVALRAWFTSTWGFDREVFSAGAGDRRQIELFEQAGLRPLGEITRPDGRRLLGYAAA
jgi:RimJ/RimL family protein N-acetyltransferase